jgi:hypothetical protein
MAIAPVNVRFWGNSGHQLAPIRSLLLTHTGATPSTRIFLIQIKVPLNRKLSLSDTARWLIAVKTAVHEWATKEPWVVVYDTILRP